MSKMFSQPTASTKGKALADQYLPVALEYNHGSPAIVIFNNGKKLCASCLRCSDTPCALFSKDEVTPNNLPQFPADKNNHVCPAGAITIDNGVPIIDGSLCMLCGSCAARCPIGAIRLVPNIGAVVEDSPNEAFRETGASDFRQIEMTREIFIKLPSRGLYLLESDPLVTDVFKRQQKAWERIGDYFPNMLARSLFFGARAKASISRKGNNNMRMDMIMSGGDTEQGLVEVEFGQNAALDASRDILDSLAVLTSRYKWALELTVPIVVSDLLPNKRSEYWHIIKDVSDVYGIRIRTLTIFALMLCNWNRVPVAFAKDMFYADINIKSYRTQVLEKMLGRDLNLGAAPRPEIDIAK